MTTERAGKWNYRVLRRGEEYSIYEVYYDSEPRIQGASVEPARLVACSLDELRRDLSLMMEATEHEVLDYAAVAREAES